MKRKHSHCTQIDEFGIFTKINCTLTIKQVAELCFKTVRTVTLWNTGKRSIPPECARLIRIYEGRELGIGKPWQGFQMIGERLALPTGQIVEPQQIIIALGVLEVSAPREQAKASQLLKYSRLLAKYKR
ncbi:regulator [Vibrio marisflavi]|uniref:HTH cro/C1-type domain-containing protein n=1 Tax=Vibrio marisflavi CECT 7928 TaxID=634439 RepID=A0ABM9A0I0_9VIBR|nr:regulator [Vibrio marisflavi]CAH0536840.1 hypothetical protein VMF7928_00731 [Vibrio marisflavi CECT 7928]